MGAVWTKYCVYAHRPVAQQQHPQEVTILPSSDLDPRVRPRHGPRVLCVLLSLHLHRYSNECLQQQSLVIFHRFAHFDDKYIDLQNYITTMLSNPEHAQYCKQRTLCKTLAGMIMNACAIEVDSFVAR